MSAYWQDVDIPIRNMLPEVVVFNGNKFGPWCKPRTFCNLDAATVVFEYLAMELWFGIVERKNIANFYHEIHEWDSFSHRLRKCNVLRFSCAELGRENLDIL